MTAWQEIQLDWAMNTEQDLVTGVLLWDLSAAFDTLDCEGLCNKKNVCEWCNPHLEQSTKKSNRLWNLVSGKKGDTYICKIIAYLIIHLTMHLQHYNLKILKCSFTLLLFTLRSAFTYFNQHVIYLFLTNWQICRLLLLSFTKVVPT